MNKPVKYTIAKLLKEKWFKEKCKEYFTDGTLSISDEPKEVFMEAVKHNKVISCLAPTIADVVMWLYEKYGIWISPTHQHNQFFWGFGSYQTQEFKTPTEAYEAAIEYALNKLI
jgi:hypothetical protein